MSILSRFKSIMESNINALLDRCEDPAKMVDQMLRDMQDNLSDVKQETAAVMADEKAAKRKVDECRENIEKYAKSARNALSSGNEDDARTLIEKKQKYEAQLTELQRTYDLAHDNAEKMRQMHDKLVHDIDDLETRRDTIKAKLQVASAQEKVNKAVSGTKNSEASMSAFERMEAKANKALDAANAKADLNAGVNKVSDLADKYSSGSSASVDAEFEKMKAEMNGG